MLVIDQLHEFKLGVWKALFTHLIRLLYAEDPSGELVSRLNLQYFKDLLQCTIPVFDRLLPEPFNGLVLNLLYWVAEWHALAKLQMHTEKSFSWFNTSIQIFAAQAAAECRAPQNATGNSNTSTGDSAPCPQASSVCQPCKLNLNTFKFHSLGDYVASIHLFGTTDSYSTQMVESILNS
ncbi:hypothetical protein F5146DRAFT_1106407 [Armillaria mellea]|nr:hypothetical protein F5146DRAFT_1106407 [Armillaria mellea]